MRKTTHNREVEVKHDASLINEAELHNFVMKLKPLSFKKVDGWDHYFMDGKRNIRFRTDGERAELTTKRRLSSTSIKTRVETNVPMAKGVPVSLIKEFCSELGLKLNFSIFKENSIYIFKHVNIAFYKVYDERMRPVGTFLEVEHLEESVCDLKKASKRVDEMEAKLAKFGISKKTRINRSLMEMYRRKR